MAFNLAGAVAAAGGFSNAANAAQAARAEQERQARLAAAQEALQRIRLQQDQQQFDATRTDATNRQTTQDRAARTAAVTGFGDRVRKAPNTPKEYWESEANALEKLYPGISNDLLYPGKVTSTGGSVTQEGADGTITNLGQVDTVAPNLPPSSADILAGIKQKATQLAMQRGVLKDQPGIEQAAVGQPSSIQNATGRSVNAARAAAGLPPLPVPFDPSGQVRRTTGISGNPDAANGTIQLPQAGNMPPMQIPTATKDYPILNPGYEPNADTAAKQAQTASLTANAKRIATEVALMPEKLRLEYQKLRQQGDHQAAQLMLSKYNADQGRAVTIRGQDMSAGTAAANRAATNTRSSITQAAAEKRAQEAQDLERRKNAQKGIDDVTAKRDAAAADARRYEAAIPTAKTDAEKKQYQAMAKTAHENWAYHDADIKSRKAQMQPRHEATGRFVPATTGNHAGARTITTKSGRKLTVQ